MAGTEAGTVAGAETGGTDTGGTDTGGTDTGGTTGGADAGGTDAGGTDAGGTDAGGTETGASFESPDGCTGAEGERGVAPDNDVGVSLPANRSCLNVQFTKVFQSNAGEFVPVGLESDNQGNLYFTGSTKGFLDTTYGDIFVVKVQANGEVVWFKIYGTDSGDGFGQDGVYDPSSGVMHMITLDDQDNIYVAANTNSRSRDNGTLLKLDSDGNSLWKVSLEEELPGRRHMFHGVSVDDGIAHVVGTRGVYAFNAEDGTYLNSFGIKLEGPQSRPLAILTGPDGIYIGGWAGFSGDDDGILVKVDWDGMAYNLVWKKRVPLTRGSKIGALAQDDEGNVYAGVNIAGATNVKIELQKWSPDGTLTWVRRYGDSLSSRMNVVKFINGQIVVGGQTHYPGTATFSESGGEGLLIIVNTDGTLAREHYYFTGTNPSSMDSVKGIANIDGDLMVVFDHAKAANFGEWRNPNDYDVLEHPWEEVNPAEYLIRDASELVHPELEINISEPEWTWTDLTANLIVVDAAADAANRPPNTSAAYFSRISNYFQ
jgi:hypothetical protein